MKLCLGTAQFGLDYGVNNVRGKIPLDEVPRILNAARDNGIVTLDTASAYGSSESVLGEAIALVGRDFQIITKYPANTDVRPFQCIDSSLEQLKTKKVYGYLFHNYSIFEKRPDYIDEFVKIRESGKSEKIGFSLYYPFEAEYILDNDIPCDIVQIPYSILDQRFAYLFPRLKGRGIEIHVRSVFLQGLFFIAPERLDGHFDSVKDILRNINQFAADHAISTAAMCLNFAVCEPDISRVVIGIDSLDNLKENIADYGLPGKADISREYCKKFAVDDENIILPFNWRK